MTDDDDTNTPCDVCGRLFDDVPVEELDEWGFHHDAHMNIIGETCSEKCAIEFAKNS